MKKLLRVSLVLFMLPLINYGQNRIHGKVVNVSNDKPLYGVTVRLKQTQISVFTDKRGEFSLMPTHETDSIYISYLGFKEVTLGLPLKSSIIELEEVNSVLEEVVISTGYYTVPKERLTGSFENINNELLNRSVSTDILSRLEGVAGSLDFDRRAYGFTDPLKMRIRGMSTINANESPLIIVDNFPFEGDINTINPNDVDNITILKDAAASSIWGARAGNGVIVITTKKSSFKQPIRIMASSNITVNDKPNLFYDPQFLNSSSFIDVETELFSRGFYNENDINKRPLSPVVELLIKKRDDLISHTTFDALIESYTNQDIRNDATEGLYRNSINQQYYVNIISGSEVFKNYSSIGYDKNLSNINENEYRRLTLNTSNTFKPHDKVELNGEIHYSLNKNINNGLELSSLYPYGKSKIYPYARLVDEEGNAMHLIKDFRMDYALNAEDTGLLDWTYKPINEIGLNEEVLSRPEFRLNAGINYSLFTKLTFEFKYQYKTYLQKKYNFYPEESYYARNLINKFTQPNGENIIPIGGISYNNFSERYSHSSRAQFTYNDVFRNSEIAAIGGVELEEDIFKAIPGSTLYGYDDELGLGQTQFDYMERYQINPAGLARIPSPPSSTTDIVDRYLSYYFNTSYTFKNKYIFSMSARHDASNLFGVNANQKGVPLWSIGGSWNISDEAFYSMLSVPYLRLRATIGHSGNVDKNVTAYTTARYFSSPTTGYNYATIQTPPNPDLRWEKVKMLNLGMDFRFKKNRLSGSFEYYSKDGIDLLGDIILDPTSGFDRSYRINYANLNTKGIDLMLNSINIDAKFKWSTNVLISWVRDKVTHYDGLNNVPALVFSGLDSPPIIGKPRYSLHSLPWYGLDPVEGSPQVMIDGKLSNNYALYNNTLKLEDLIYHGSLNPELFGSLRNTFSFKRISISANAILRANYYFRRSSISYTELFNSWLGHRDFVNRWQVSGDERFTNIPSMPDRIVSQRDAMYLNSEVLVSRADNLRLKDINISYHFGGNVFKNSPIHNFLIFLYADNLGIIWKASKVDFDPDYPKAAILPAKSVSLGLKFNF